METLIDTSKAARAGGHILVDRTKAMELMDQLRLAVPKEVRAAEEVLAEIGYDRAEIAALRAEGAI